MSYLAKMRELVSQAFQGNETPEAEAALQLIQEESVLIEETIRNDIEKINSEYQDLRTKHVELLKSVPSENEPNQIKSSAEVYAAWKAQVK